MMRRFTFIAVVVASLSVFLHARPANAFAELNVFYFSEGLTTDASTTGTRMFIDASVGAELGRKNNYLVGWNYTMHSTSDAGTATTTYSSTQMGPRFVYIIDSARQWSVGLGYYLVTSGTYDSGGGGTAPKWKGSALKFDFGYSFPVADSLFMGLRFNYSQASYVEQITGETTFATIAYSKTSMYPSLYMVFYF